MTTPALQNFMVARDRKTYAQKCIDDGALGLWMCGDAFGASTLADSSGNGRNATLSGTRALGAKAKNSRLGGAISWTAASGFASIASASWFQLTGDMTAECWLHLQEQPASSGVVRLITVAAVGETTATNAVVFFTYVNNGGTLQLQGFHESGSGTDNDTRQNVTLSLRDWHHLVLTRDVSTNTYEFFVDGVSIGTQGYTTDPSGGTSANLHFNSSAAGPTPSTITNQQTAYALYGSKLTAAQIAEHYRLGKRDTGNLWKNTVFMCNFQGADAAVAVADESSFGRVITFSGNAQLDTAQAPAGFSSSLLLDGTGDFIAVPDHADTEIAGLEFTIEFWVRMNTGGRLQTICGKRDTSSAEEHTLNVNATNNLNFSAFNAGSAIVTLTDAGAMSTGTWYHVAVQRIAGNVWTMHRDGVLVDSDTVASSANTNAQGWTIGRDVFNTARDWDGWIGGGRFTQNASRYPASNFTPPSGPFLPYQ